MLRQTRDQTLSQRARTANALIDSLRELEATSTAAMAGSSAFLSQLIAARADARLSPIFGHDAVASIAAANSAFVEGMGHVAQAHRQLNEMRGKVGLTPVAWGDVEPCPDAIEQQPQTVLRSVG